jgi:hypothetical protein
MDFPLAMQRIDTYQHLMDIQSTPDLSFSVQSFWFYLDTIRRALLFQNRPGTDCRPGTVPIEAVAGSPVLEVAADPLTQMM